MCQNGNFLLFLAHVEHTLNSDYVDDGGCEGVRLGARKLPMKRIQDLYSKIL